MALHLIPLSYSFKLATLNFVLCHLYLHFEEREDTLNTIGQGTNDILGQPEDVHLEDYCIVLNCKMFHSVATNQLPPKHQRISLKRIAHQAGKVT
ncbi:hypothetical protein AAZX31_01G058400 [Glycine max]